MKKILILLLSISFAVSIKAQSMLCTYQGGYFIQNGKTWYEYRPQDKDGIWNTYSQYSSDENYFFIRNKSNNISIPKEKNNSIWILKNNKWEVQYQTINVYNYCPVKGAKLFTYKDGFFIKTDNSWQEYIPLKKQNGAFDSFTQDGIDNNFYYIKNNRISLAIPRNTSKDFFWKKDGKWVKLYAAETVYDNSPPTTDSAINTPAGSSSPNSNNQSVADNNSSHVRNKAQYEITVDCLWLKSMDEYWNSPINWEPNARLKLIFGNDGKSFWAEISRIGSNSPDRSHLIGKKADLILFKDDKIVVLMDTDKSKTCHKFIRMIGYNIIQIGITSNEDPDGEISDLCKLSVNDCANILKFLITHIDPINK